MSFAAASIIRSAGGVSRWIRVITALAIFAAAGRITPKDRKRKTEDRRSRRMIKVLITDKLAKEGIDLLNSMDGVQAVIKAGVSEDELAKIIGEYDGLIIRSGTKVTAKVLANPGK
jgi:hypothetical protein